MEKKKDGWENITNYIQSVCSNHEYLETKLTTSSNDVVDINYQCKHCGYTISVSKKAILDKAEYLVRKFIEPTQDWDEIEGKWVDVIEKAAQCAIIAIQEIIDACEYNMVERWNADWWNKVKAQIESMVV